MAIILKIKQKLSDIKYSLQLKYAVSYIAIILACLAFTNIYPIISYRDMLFELKYASLKNQASLIASSLSPLSTLKEEEVGKVLDLLNDTNLERILITDNEARIVYDSLGNKANIGKYVLFPEVLKALTGKDVFYSKIKGSVISSRACLPVLSEGTITGTVYIYEYDSQPALIESCIKHS